MSNPTQWFVQLNLDYPENGGSEISSFPTEEGMLDFVQREHAKRASDENCSWKHITVIQGRFVEIEPVEVATQFRAKP